MLDKWQKKLVISNAAVLLVVMSVFCVVVYVFGCSSFDKQFKEKLYSIADSAISSIDFDDYGQNHNGKPDLIVSVLGDEASPALQEMRLQWFTPNGDLDIEKGSMRLTVPFLKKEVFQSQQNPDALVLTKPAISKGRILGYVRVGHPLRGLSQQKALLLQCLILGNLAAILVGAAGVFILVKQSLKPVEENIQNLKQFCADAAHELRSPITAIQANSSVALRHPEGMRESDKEKFEAIMSGAKQMERLTVNLLSLAKAEQLAEERLPNGLVENLNLKNVVDSIYQNIDSVARAKRVALRNEIPDNLVISMNRDDIESIVVNLIDNAVKYTTDGGDVSTAAICVNSMLKVTITDTGIGIDPKDQDKIFERFWRSDQVRSYHSGGNGLGLSIVKAIVEKYGGSIHVQSEKGDGTTFKVNLRIENRLPSVQGE